MIVFYIIIFHLFFTIPSYAFETFYVYVKNTTPEILLLSNGTSVLNNSQAIFESFPIPSETQSQQKIMVKGTIYAKFNPAKQCSVNFKTYTNLDSFHVDHRGDLKVQRFLTFIIVSEKNNQLICEPIAAEVSGNTMLPYGMIKTIKKAKQDNKKAEQLLSQRHQVYNPKTGKIENIPQPHQLQYYNPQIQYYNPQTRMFEYFNPQKNKLEFNPQTGQLEIKPIK
jgi:hypothetical protein